MIKKSTLALICCTFFLSQLSHAEYLIYKKVGPTNEVGTLSEQEYEEVYKVLLRNQWPTCLIFDENSASDKSEHEKIESEIKALGNKYSIVYVPTLLYELFAIFNNSIYGLGQEISDLPINQMHAIKNLKKKSLEARQNIIRDALLHHRVKATHHIVNNTLLEFLTTTNYYAYNRYILNKNGQISLGLVRKRPMPFSLFVERFSPQCINQLLMALTKTDNDTCDKLLPLLHHSKIIRRLLALERRAYRADKATVYRSITNCADFAFGQVRIRPVEIPAMLGLLPKPFRATRLKESFLERYFELENNAKLAEKHADELDEMELIEFSELKKAAKKDTQDESLILGNASTLSNSSTCFLANFFDTENPTLYTDLMLPANPDNDLTAGIVLFLDKKKYGTDNEIRSLFPVAPISTLVGLFLNQETVACMAAASLNQPHAEGRDNDQEQQHPDALLAQAMRYAKFVSTHGNIHILKVPNDEESADKPPRQEQESQLEAPHDEAQDVNGCTLTTNPQGTANYQELDCIDVHNAGGYCPEPETAAKYMYNQKTLLIVLRVLRNLRTYRRHVQTMAQMHAGFEAVEIRA